MSELLAQSGLAPFLAAAVLVLLLLILEAVLMILGLSSSESGDAPGVEAAGDTGLGDTGLGDMTAAELSAEFNMDAELAAEIEAEFNINAVEPQIADPQSNLAKGGPATSVLAHLFDLLGLRHLPLTVWLALFAGGFASLGLAVQVGLNGLLGSMLPATAASVLVLVPAAFFARGMSRWVARLIPRDETSAISERSLGRRRGVVTVGTARRGQPAQVRITDHHGNIHYAMVEPFSDKDEISAGTEALVLRTRTGELRLIPLG